MELQIAFDKDSKFQKKLEQVYKATGDLTIPLTLMAREWLRGNKSIFVLKSKGRYKDLTERYKVQKKNKHKFVYPILKATGRLASSITEGSNSESINRILSDKKTLQLGTRVPYGVYHQSDLPRTKMPYRPFLFLGVEQIAPQDIKQNRVKNWIKILDSYFQQKANA